MIVSSESENLHQGLDLVQFFITSPLPRERSSLSGF
jgi:hypothetical protein